MKQPGSIGTESQGVSPDSRFPLPVGTAPLVLASASPRRRELLGFLGVPFRAIATTGEEQEHPPPADVVAALPPFPLALATHPSLLAWRKADAACAEAPDSVIIGADTIVVLGSDVLGKPRDRAHAHVMLRRLSGRTHTVYTGLAVLDTRHTDARLAFDLVASDVTIADLTDSEIADYIATGEPMDKAGAYGIQGLGGRLVHRVVGSYTCVVGLPLLELDRLLTAAGIAGLTDPIEAYRRWLGAQGKEPLPCPPTFP
jgi:septum formation protein